MNFSNLRKRHERKDDLTTKLVIELYLISSSAD